MRGAIIRDRESRGTGGTWNKPDLRDIALRRLTGAALLELTVELKLGVCNIGALESIDDLINFLALPVIPTVDILLMDHDVDKAT